MTDKICESLDIIPYDEKESFEIEQLDYDEIDDFDYARKVMLDVLQKGQAALVDMAHVAKSSEHPRAYEVLNSSFKTIADIAKDLIELQKKKTEIDSKKMDSEKEPTIINNHLFVGSNEELNDFLQKNRENKNAIPEQ